MKSYTGKISEQSEKMKMMESKIKVMSSENENLSNKLHEFEICGVRG